MCIHEGTAESGHYYSYIKDHKQGVWRQYNDHKVKIVEDEQVFEDANCGESVKAAYYIIYISQEELDAKLSTDENFYEPNEVGFESRHPYGLNTKPEIMNKILEDNRKLSSEADEYKAAEIAKRVTTLYEKNYDEIQKVLELKINNKQIGSIYTDLMLR